MKEKEVEKCTGCNKNITTEEYISNGGYCEKCMDKIEEKEEQEEIKTNITTANKMSEKTIITIIVTIIAIIAFISGLAGNGSSSKSEWDKLTKEEKAWYKRNYGNGKSQEIDRAIEKYKNK